MCKKIINRLVQIEKNIYKKVNNSETDEIEYKQKIVQIKYDVLGRRIEKKFNNNSYRKYYYSNQDIILEENYSKKDKLKNSKEFTYSNSLDDALSMKLVEYKTRKIEEEFVNKKGVTKTRKIKEEYVETNNYFYQKDHLGSIIAITDETGTIVEEYSYDIFGKPYTKKSDGTITRLKKSPIGNTRMYTGREYDRGLKLYYNRARYYNPQLGRFISRDPIDIADDVNLYAYVGNNSIMYNDPSGEVKQFIAGFSFGDYHTSGNGYSIAGQIIAGIVPYYGQAADVRDFKYQWSNGSYGDIALAGIAFVPLFGDGVKAVNNSGIIQKSTKWLTKGKENNVVYIGYKNGKAAYVGITDNINRRLKQHLNSGKLDDLVEVVGGLTRNQARSVEQIIKEANEGFLNKYNSIGPKRDIYNSAIDWGYRIYEKK